jgi:predicted nuclease of predicted toxin-antitoxin system
MVEFVIHGYGYGYEYKNVSAGKFFMGMDIQYPYPLLDGYLTCGTFRFNTLSEILIFQFPFMTCCLVLKLLFDVAIMIKILNWDKNIVCWWMLSLVWSKEAYDCHLWSKTAINNHFLIVLKANNYKLFIKKWSPPKIREPILWQENMCGVSNKSLSSKIDGHMTDIFG